MDFVTDGLSLSLSLCIIHICNGKPQGRTEGEPMVDDTFLCRDGGWDVWEQPVRYRGAQDTGKDKSLDIRVCCLSRDLRSHSHKRSAMLGSVSLQGMNWGACISMCVHTQRLNICPWHIHLWRRPALSWQSLRTQALLAEESKPVIMSGRHSISVWVRRWVVLSGWGACFCPSASRTVFSLAPQGKEWRPCVTPCWRSNWKQCPKSPHLVWDVDG